MSKAPYKAISINGRVYLLGKPVFVVDTPFDLRVGAEYVQIGNRPRTSTNHFDEFTSPVTYSGSITISGVRYIAFKISTETVKELGLFDKIEPLYMIYVPNGINMIYSYDCKAQKNLILKPVFKKPEVKLD